MDGFSQLFASVNSSLGTHDPARVISFTTRSSWSTTLAQSISKALGDIRSDNPALFIEGLDFFLAAGEESITTIETITLLSNLSEVLSLSISL